jgi:hypothetical protein
MKLRIVTNTHGPRNFKVKSTAVLLSYSDPVVSFNVYDRGGGILLADLLVDNKRYAIMSDSMRKFYEEMLSMVKDWNLQNKSKLTDSAAAIKAALKNYTDNEEDAPAGETIE